MNPKPVPPTDRPVSTIAFAECGRRLGITRGTLRNWVRLGKIRIDETGASFDPAEVERIEKELRTNPESALHRRRNKRQHRQKVFYRNYATLSGANIRAIKRLLAEPALCHAPRQLLTACARQLFRERFGRVPEGECELRLLRDIAGRDGSPQPPEPVVAAVETSGIAFESGADLLGTLYLSLQCGSRRKSSGSYYTPQPLVEALLPADFEHPEPIYDPCCGSGNFLLQWARHGQPPELLFGCDLDPLAVALARWNLLLELRPAKPELLEKNLVVGNSLRRPLPPNCRRIVGNPPWGGDRQKSRKPAEPKTTESCVLFLHAALTSLPPGGTVTMVLPEALLTVKLHEAIRRRILDESSITELRYLGHAFATVHCPAIVVTLRKNDQTPPTPTRVLRRKQPYHVAVGRENNAEGLRFHLTDAESDLFRQLQNLPGAMTLRGHAKFALGIVTGDNRNALRPAPFPGGEPVWRGSEIGSYRLDEPQKYLEFRPERFQQIAEVDLFRAEEKLLYRFIGRELHFAYDPGQRLSLNSCNVLIPQLPGVPVLYVQAVLNSRTAQFFHQSGFPSLKVLRSHLEAQPIPAAPGNVMNRIADLAAELNRSSDSAERIALYEKLEELFRPLYRLTAAQIALIRAAVPSLKR